MSRSADKNTLDLRKEMDGELRENEGRELITHIQLTDKRACLPPISRLSFDILSLAFQICGQDDWRAPLRIGVVNRQFREVILATPRAWTFIRLDHRSGAKLMTLYFERSGGYLHHILLNYESDFDQLRSVSHRIQCLTTSPLYFNNNMSDLDLPNLTRLRLDGGVYLSEVATSRLPALQHLSVPYIHSNPSAVKLTFPPLQSLQLVVYSDTAWIKLLQGCQSTLAALRIGISDVTEFVTYPDICLPKLRALWLTSLFNSEWPIYMKTSELATYVQYHSSLMPYHHLLHKDLSSVASLCLHYVPSFSTFPRLHTFNLAMGPSNAHLEIMAQLNTGDDTCTLLTLLVLNMLNMSLVERQEAQKTMNEWSMRHRPGLVTRVTGPEQSLDLPEVTKALCGYQMPCGI